MQTTKESRRTVILVDSSVSITGALKCAVQQALLMQTHYRYIIVLPQKSNAVNFVREQGIKVYTLPLVELRKSIPVFATYPFHLWANAKRLQQLVTTENAGILMMNDNYNLLGACMKFLDKGIKLFTYVRLQPKVMPGVLNRVWVNTALRYSDAVIAVSQCVANQLPRHSKVKVVYDAVQFQEQYPPYTVVPDKDVIELLYLGNYIRGKGQDHAIRAFALAYRKDNRLRLTFRGGDMGLEKNKAFKKELEQMAAAERLSAVIRFLPFAADVEKEYKQADIFLNFSEAESFSMTCAEAAFYGVPVIATRCGGPEEIFADGSSGLLVPNQDLSVMAQAITLLASDDALRAKFSNNSRQVIRKKFSSRSFIEAMQPLLFSAKTELAGLT